MSTLANSDDPDEMLHYAAFHQGLHCSLSQKRSSEKEIQFLFGNDLPVSPQYIQWTIPSILNQTRTPCKTLLDVYGISGRYRRKNSLVHKGLIIMETIFFLV